MRAVSCALLVLFFASCATLQLPNCGQKLPDSKDIRAKVVAIIEERNIPRPDWNNLDQEYLEAEKDRAEISYTAYFKAAPLGSIYVRFDCGLERARVQYNKYGEFSDYAPYP